MKLTILLGMILVIGCSAEPTLEQLEDEAKTTGDWEAVERREDVLIKRLESTAPGCPVGERKKCVEEQSGIECYCLPDPQRRRQ